jgi:hypothetical protein
MEHLVKELRKIGGYEIGLTDKRQITLRFPGAPPRASWSEDVSVYLDNGRILVAVHGGTSRERSTLLKHLVAIYRHAGAELEFLEE